MKKQTKNQNRIPKQIAAPFKMSSESVTANISPPIGIMLHTFFLFLLFNNSQTLIPLYKQTAALRPSFPCFDWLPIIMWPFFRGVAKIYFRHQLKLKWWEYFVDIIPCQSILKKYWLIGGLHKNVWDRRDIKTGKKTKVYRVVVLTTLL